MKDHGIKNNDALQGYFSGRVQKLVVKHGKIVVAGRSAGAGRAQGHRNSVLARQASLALAAKQGYRGILSNGYYLDLGWSAARHYAADPLSGDAANLSPKKSSGFLAANRACGWNTPAGECGLANLAKKCGDC